MRDLKYLFAYTVPVTAFISFESIGLGTYVSVMYTFIALPFLDLVTGEKTKNLSTEEVTIKKTNWVFDGMLYLNLPIVFGLLWLVFSKIQTQWKMPFLGVLTYKLLASIGILVMSLNILVDTIFVGHWNFSRHL